MEKERLPERWVKTTLGDAVMFERVLEHPGENSTLQFIGLEHVEAETMRLIGTIPAQELKSTALHFWPGDVLYGRLRPYLNKVLQLDFEGLCSAEFFVFRKSANLNSSYLQYFLNSWDFKEFASQQVTGDRPRVDWDQLKVFDFPLAPLPEQNRIVAVIEQQFSRIDNGIASLRSAQEKAKQYRASLLKSAVEGELTKEWRAEHLETETGAELLKHILDARRAHWEEEQLAKMRKKGSILWPDSWKGKYKEPQGPDVESLLELPEGWCWATLEQCSRRITDGTHQPPPFVKAGIPFIFVKHIVKGQISFEDTKYISEATYQELNSRCPVELGDILYSAVGSYGVAVPVTVSRPFSFQRHIAHIKPSLLLNLNYLVACLNSSIGLEQAHRVARGVAQKTVTLTDLARFVIPLPPLAEQAQIVAEVEAQLSNIEQLEATIKIGLEKAEHDRQSILQDAFAGRLVEQDSNDEPASELLERIREEQKKREESEKVTRASRRGTVMGIEKRRRNRKAGTDQQKVDLYKTLVEVGQPLTPDDLFRHAGLEVDEQSESVEVFYEELHADVKADLIKVVPDDTSVLLEALEPSAEMLASMEEENEEVPALQEAEQHQEIAVDRPTLWDV